MANATHNINAESATQGSRIQVVRTPGWVVYGEYTTLAAAAAAAEAAQKTDDGNVFVHMEACGRDEERECVVIPSDRPELDLALDERPITMRTEWGNVEVVESVKSAQMKPLLYVVDMLHITLTENLVGMLDAISERFTVAACCSPKQTDDYMEMSIIEHKGGLVLAQMEPAELEDMMLTSFGEEPRADAEVIHIASAKEIVAAYEHQFSAPSGVAEMMHEEAVIEERITENCCIYCGCFLHEDAMTCRCERDE